MQARHGPGTWEGGRFAPTVRKAATIQLDNEALASGWLPHDFAINDDYPLPQANDLDKIALTVKAVRAKANTATAIADVLEVTPREGNYYAAAAGYLGLIESDRDEDGRTVFYPTAAGNLLDTAEGQDRAQVLAEIVDHAPGVQAFLDGGPESVAELYAMDGRVNDTTSDRRIATIASWVNQTADIQRLSHECAEAVDGSAQRLEVAAAACLEEARQRRAERIAAREAAKPAVCMTHFVQLPATGVCDQCVDEQAA